MRILMRMRRKKNSMQIMDHRRMWRTEGIVGDVDWYECDDPATDDEEYASQAEEGSPQIVEY